MKKLITKREKPINYYNKVKLNTRFKFLIQTYA